MSVFPVQNNISGQVSKNTFIKTWLLGFRKNIMSKRNIRAVFSSPKSKTCKLNNVKNNTEYKKFSNFPDLLRIKSRVTV